MVSLGLSSGVRERIRDNITVLVRTEGFREVVREFIRGMQLGMWVPRDIEIMRELSRVSTEFCTWLGVPIIGAGGIISDYFVAFRNPLIVGYFKSTTYIAPAVYRLVGVFTSLYMPSLMLTPFSFINYVRLFLDYGYKQYLYSSRIIEKYKIDYGTWLHGYCILIREAMDRFARYVPCELRGNYLPPLRACYTRFPSDPDALYRCLSGIIERDIAYVFTASLTVCNLGNELISLLRCGKEEGEGEGGH